MYADLDYQFLFPLVFCRRQSKHLFFDNQPEMPGLDKLLSSRGRPNHEGRGCAFDRVRAAPQRPSTVATDIGYGLLLPAISFIPIVRCSDLSPI